MDIGLELQRQVIAFHALIKMIQPNPLDHLCPDIMCMDLDPLIMDELVDCIVQLREGDY